MRLFSSIIKKIGDAFNNVDSVIVTGARKPNNKYSNLESDEYGNLKMSINSPINTDETARLRTSILTSQIDLKQLYDQLPLFIDIVASGGATAVHSTTEARTRITTAGPGSFVVAQTKQRGNYRSGKPMEIYWSVSNLQTVVGQEINVGYFSSSIVSPFTASYDGFFLQSKDGAFSVNVYKSGTLIQTVPRANWDDPLDGTGPSGKIIDWTNSEVIKSSFLWLGVDSVSWYVKLQGLLIKFHQINFTNTIPTVYMSSPNQPMRWEYRQTGATPIVSDFICSTMGTEGQGDTLGLSKSINMGNTFINANTAGTKYALIGIQLQAGKEGTTIEIDSAFLQSITSDNYLWEILLNPTVAGVFTYSPVTNSSVNIAIGDVAGNPSTNTVTGGTLLKSGYGNADTGADFNVKTALKLGATIAGVRDTIVVVITPRSAGLDISGSLNWNEQL